MGTLLATRFWYLHSAVIGVVLGIGFVFPSLWWASLLGVMGFIAGAVAAPTPRIGALGGFIAWTIKSLLAISWFFSAKPFAWLPAEYSEPSVFTITIFTLYVALLLGAGGAGVAVVTQFVAKNLRPILFYISFPFLWVLGEVLASFIFSVGTYGDGGSLGISFSFGYSGYLLAEHDTFIQLGLLGGAYLLSAASASVGSGLWYLGLKWSLRASAGAIVGVLFLCILTAHLSPRSNVLPEERIVVAVVETEFTGAMMRSEDWTAYRSAALDEAVRAALTQEPDYILLPEDARFTPAGGSVETMYDRYRFLYGDGKTIVLDSRTVLTGEGDTVLRAYLFDGPAQTGWSVDKQTLVPAGEYVPYATRLVTQVLAPGLTESLEKTLSYRPGPLSSQEAFAADVPAVLFCFESADPLAVWRLARERDIPFVAHPISHAIFDNPTVLWHQLDTMLRVQALFNNVPIVSAGNEAKSTLYLPDGTMQYPDMVTSGEGWQVGLLRW